MTGIHLTVPVACFRKGMAREYLETEPVPPPSTCYGFLLSLVGEADRRRHLGVRVAPALVKEPATSVVLRTLWRVKKRPLGSTENARPDYQQLLTNLEVVIWLDSTGEAAGQPKLEARVGSALAPSARNAIERFGGLSLGESTHLVNDVNPFAPVSDRSGLVFLLHDEGRLTLPVWVDHVGSTHTNYVTGDLEETSLTAPLLEQMPCIQPKSMST